MVFRWGLMGGVVVGVGGGGFVGLEMRVGGEPSAAVGDCGSDLLWTARTPTAWAGKVGITQSTVAQHLFEEPTSQFRADRKEIDRALVEVIAALAPLHVMGHDKLFRYAWSKEPEHLWNLGRYPEIIDSLRWRETPVASQNLPRWVGWHDRFEEFGDEALWTLVCACHIERLRLEVLKQLPDSKDDTTKQIHSARRRYRETLVRLLKTHGLGRNFLVKALLRANIAGDP